MRRERFVEELESYSKQLEEFQSFGDMQEIQRYLKKAQALNQRLESAAEKVIITLQTLFYGKIAKWAVLRQMEVLILYWQKNYL